MGAVIAAKEALPKHRTACSQATIMLRQRFFLPFDQ
jgi:hypothetical protein